MARPLPARTTIGHWHLGALVAAFACFLPVLPAAALDLGQGFRPVTDPAAGPAALHGSLLAWVGSDGAIHLTDLQNGTRQALTFLPPGTRVQSLDFDGTWIAWCDGRFGRLEAFAMHVGRLELVRLDPKAGPATDITVGGGHAAWLEDGTLKGSDLESPAPRRLSWIPGLAFTPSIDRDLLVWSQLVGAERRLAGLRWGGNATLLTLDGPTVLDTDPQAADGRVAWRSESRTAPASDPSSRSLGQRIVAAALQVAPLEGRNLTQPGPHEDPVVGGSWIGWMEEGDTRAFVAFDLTTGAIQRIPGPIHQAMVSGTHVVVVPVDGSPLQARAWSDAPGTARVAGAAMSIAAALLVAAAFARRR